MTFADRDEIVSNRVRLWDTGRCRILKAWRVLRRDIATPRPEPRIPRHRLPGRVFPRLPRPDLRCLEDEDRGLRDAEGLVPALHRNGLRTLLRGVPASSENPVPLPSCVRAFSLVSDRGPARHRLFDRSDLQFLLHPGPFENGIWRPWGGYSLREDVLLLSDRERVRRIRHLECSASSGYRVPLDRARPTTARHSRLRVLIWPKALRAEDCGDRSPALPRDPLDPVQRRGAARVRHNLLRTFAARPVHARPSRRPPRSTPRDAPLCRRECGNRDDPSSFVVRVCTSMNRASSESAKK